MWIGSQEHIWNHSQQDEDLLDEDLLDVEDSVVFVGEDDDVFVLLFSPLAPNAMTGQLLAKGRAEGVGQGEGQERQEDMACDRRRRFLWVALQIPPLLELSEGGVLDEAAQVVEVQHFQWVLYGQTAQEDLLVPGFVVLSLPLGPVSYTH